VITTTVRDKHYQPVLVQQPELARAILLLEQQGVYTFTSVSPAPAPFIYEITNYLAHKHYTLPTNLPASYYRGNRTIAIEFMVDTSQSYTVQWLHNNQPQPPIVIPPLPYPPVITQQRTPIYPFAHNHLAGYLYDVRVLGSYQSGGMRVDVPTSTNGVITTVVVPLSETNYLFSAYRDSSGEWKIIIRNPNGTELPAGTPVDTWLRVYVWAHYR